MSRSATRASTFPTPDTTCERRPEMIRLLRARLQQGHRTVSLTAAAAGLPARYRGRPVVDPEKCGAECRACVEACPTGAIAADPLRIDLGACLFCGACEAACPGGAVTFTRDHRMT